jgi:hypothetical protein
MHLIFVTAIGTLMLGHVLRAVRQATLFPVGARPGNFHLTVGLSVAYVINALLPFRIGEIARCLYVSVRDKQSFGMVCATVIAERLSDLAAVAAILCCIVLLSGDTQLLAPALQITAMGAVATGALRLLTRSPRARALYWSAASLFNDEVRLKLVDIAWTTAQLINSGSLLRPHYLLLTGLMWSAYLAAYALLAAAIGIDVSTVITTLLATPLSPLLGAPSVARDLALATSLTAILILVAGLTADSVGMRASVRTLLRFGLPKAELQLALSGQSFARTSDYGAVLDAHFTDRESTIAHFGLHGLEGARVRHLLPGGSDAITAVVETDQGLVIRKFATGDAGRKLLDQAEWLDAHRSELPLAKLISQNRSASKFHYDMPLLHTARDLYEMVHITPFSESRRLLENLVDHVASWHATHVVEQPCEEAVDAYVQRKIIDNARIALNFARQRLPECFRINNETHQLRDWDRLLDPTWAKMQMPTRATSLIHGDLTIENIIVSPDSPRGWYLIDPNPGNLFDSPLIDWAKLMQSLNLGYESLNRGAAPQVRGDAIDVMFHRSRIYSDLHAGLREQLSDRLGAPVLREIAFHEIVNYLRLIPYKIRRNPAKALTFFASTSLLLRRYENGLDG